MQYLQTVKFLTVKLSMLLLMLIIINANALPAARNISNDVILEVAIEGYNQPTKHDLKNMTGNIIDKVSYFRKHTVTDIRQWNIQMKELQKLQNMFHRSVRPHSWKRRSQSRIPPFGFSNNYNYMTTPKHKLLISNLLKTKRPSINSAKSKDKLKDINLMSSPTLKYSNNSYPQQKIKLEHPWQGTVEPWGSTYSMKSYTSTTIGDLALAKIIMGLIVCILYVCYMIFVCRSCLKKCCEDDHTSKRSTLYPLSETSSSPRGSAFTAAPVALPRTPSPQSNRRSRPITRSGFANRMRNALGRNVEMTTVRMSNEADGNSTFNISSSLGNNRYGSAGDSLQSNYDQYYDRFTEFQNPLTLGDEIQAVPLIHGRSSISNRQSSTSNTRDSSVTIPTTLMSTIGEEVIADVPPNYAEVAISDLSVPGSQAAFDRVVSDPEECPPPHYDAVFDINNGSVNPSAPLEHS